MLNVISTCQDILCVDINVDKRCVDHSTIKYYQQNTITHVTNINQPYVHLYHPYATLTCVETVPDVQSAIVQQKKMHSKSWIFIARLVQCLEEVWLSLNQDWQDSLDMYF